MSNATEPPPTINDLIAVSGLTVNQIARLFGVPGRAVHGWIWSRTVPVEHEVRLHHLHERMAPLGDTPEERRRELLRSSAGPSILRTMVSEVPQPQVIQWPGISVLERLGIG